VKIGIFVSYSKTLEKGLDKTRLPSNIRMFSFLMALSRIGKRLHESIFVAEMQLKYSITGFISRI